MAQSSIEWTEQTWNPVTGCTKISPGCKFCYAERFASRLQSMGVENYRNGFKLTLHPYMIEKPLEWKKPSVIFVNSMSDLFHKDVPEKFILAVFETMNKAHWHQFQILTKRPERVLEMNKKLHWTPNIWMGASVENEDYMDRIDFLRKTSAKIKFLSLEPLLGPLPNINLKKIDWVIVGGESGPKARPMKPEWLENIASQCIAAEVAFFFKQWGAWGADGVKRSKHANGREFQGRTWNDVPLGTQTQLAI